MDLEERKRKAMEFHAKLHPDGRNQPLTSDDPRFLSFQSLVEFVKLLADVDNEAFTQLDKGKIKNPFVDETELFTIAVHFSEHPLDDIADELSARGITEKIIIKKTTVPKTQAESYIKDSKYNVKLTENTDGTVTIEEYEEKPLTFQVQPLRDYAKEWMRKRVPVNRRRVDEIIKLAGAARIGEMANPTQQMRESTSEMQRLRV